MPIRIFARSQRGDTSSGAATLAAGRFQLATRIGFILALVASCSAVGRAAAPLDFGAAGPKNFALLGLGSPTNISISGSSTVQGAVPQVGMAARGDLQITGNSSIAGKVFINQNGVVQQSDRAVISGGIVYNADTLLNQAVQDARAASTRLDGLAANAAGQPQVRPAITCGIVQSTDASHHFSYMQREVV